MAVYLILKQVLKRIFRGAFPILFGTTIFVILVGSLVIYFVEKGINPGFQNWGDALWWIVVTISTVGYGNKVPLTLIGRISAFIVMIAGPVILVSFVGSIGEIRYDEWQKGARGMSQITSKGHIIICGWGSRLQRM
jgi:voltage-gated potassium channel